jgi:hypothetical protein
MPGTTSNKRKVRQQALGRHVSVRFGSPGRRFTFGVQADLVGELGDYV